MHFSSVRAFSDLGFPDGVTEDHPVRPDGNPYVDTKIASEQVVLQAHAAGELDCTVVRPGDVYGPGSRPWTLLPLEYIRAGRFLLPARGRGVFSAVYVDDLVGGVVLAASHPEAAGQVFTLGPAAGVEHPRVLRPLLPHARQARPDLPADTARRRPRRRGRPAERLRGNRTEVNAASMRYLARRGGYSIEKARRVLGYEPAVSLDEGMRRTEAWLRAEGLLDLSGGDAAARAPWALGTVDTSMGVCHDRRLMTARGGLKVEQVELHGHPVTYHRLGEGPALVLVHGITSSSRTWHEVLPALAENHTVIAPDLLGHGGSAKPRGDYSLGAHASGLRDLLALLGIASATMVGHSLGGGIAMQFAYQFPERLERLVLVDSGGLGNEVSIWLRAATLPGSEYVLPLLFGRPARTRGLRGRQRARPPRRQAEREHARDRGGHRVARRRRRPPGLRPHRPLGDRPVRPARGRARPALPLRRRADAARVGRERRDHPRRARPPGA